MRLLKSLLNTGGLIRQTKTKLTWNLCQFIKEALDRLQRLFTYLRLDNVLYVKSKTVRGCVLNVVMLFIVRNVIWNSTWEVIERLTLIRELDSVPSQKTGMKYLTQLYQKYALKVSHSKILQKKTNNQISSKHSNLTLIQKKPIVNHRITLNNNRSPRKMLLSDKTLKMLRI
jgi:hypothetical protein